MRPLLQAWPEWAKWPGWLWQIPGVEPETPGCWSIGKVLALLYLRHAEGADQPPAGRFAPRLISFGLHFLRLFDR